GSRLKDRFASARRVLWRANPTTARYTRRYGRVFGRLGRHRVATAWIRCELPSFSVAGKTAGCAALNSLGSFRDVNMTAKETLNVARVCDHVSRRNHPAVSDESH